MKPRICLAVLLIVVLGCQSKNFEEIELSYSSTFEADFSMKISESYSVWLRDHFNRYEFTADSATAPKEGIYYLSRLSATQQDTLNLFLENIDFKRFNSRYYEDYKDGREYRFYIRTKAFSKTIYVHSDESPKELDSLVEWLKETRRRLELVESLEKVYFRSRLWLPTPPPPPDIIRE